MNARLRRSAHLLQRPQWRPSCGSMHEKVCSSGQAAAQVEHVGLGEVAERRDDVERDARCPRSHERREAGEELIGGVGERVALQRAEGDGVRRRAARTTRSAWRGAAGCGRAGRRPRRAVARRARRLTGHTPVRAVDRWRSASRAPRAGSGAGARQGVEEAAEMGLLGRLPRQPEAHVDRGGRPMPRRRRSATRTALSTPPLARTAIRRRRAPGSTPTPLTPHPGRRSPTCTSRAPRPGTASGSAGCSRSQIHRASTSLVGFSSPSISLR